MAVSFVGVQGMSSRAEVRAYAPLSSEDGEKPQAADHAGAMGSGSDGAFDAFTDRSAWHRTAEPVVHRGGDDPEHAREGRLCDLTLAQVRPERRRPASTFELGHASWLQFSESRGKRIAVNSELWPNYAVEMTGFSRGAEQKF